MRRPYLKLERASVTDDGYPVRGCLLITADPPGGARWWSNLSDRRSTRRSAGRVYRELGSPSLRPLAIAGGVIACDTATKLELDVPAELLHDRPLSLAIAGALLVLPVALVGIRYSRRFATPAALIVAGATCNLAWVAFSAGGPDPIIVTRGGTFVAFNLADVAIAAGALLALARVAAGILAELARRPEPTR